MTREGFVYPKGTRKWSVPAEERETTYIQRLARSTDVQETYWARALGATVFPDLTFDIKQ